MGRPVPGDANVAGLRDFQRRRLDLADMLRAVLPIARRYADERRERDIRSLLTRLASGRFQLAVAGQFSRGKTTLMNALLGGQYLPTGALPTTSVITTVRYGSRARALVRSHASALPVEVPVADVGTFVAESGTERVRMRVSSVDVELPAELLRLGFEFVDTPGVGSAIAANTAVTLRYLPQADAVVFVTGFDSALTQAEADFLVRAAGQAGRLFLVINKRDLVSERQASEVTGYVRRWARQHLGAQPPEVFALSALDALESAVQPDAGRLSRSGIAPFRAALIEFLTNEQGKTSLRAVAAAAAGIVGRQQRDMRAGRAEFRDQDAAALAAELDARMSDLQTRLSAIAGSITGGATAAVAALLADSGAQWRAALHELLEPLAGTARGDDGERESGHLAAALDALRAAGRQTAGAWLEERAADVRAAVVGATSGQIGSLLELADMPREQGAQLLGLPAFPAARAGWSAEDLPDLLVPVVEWAVPDQPVRRRRARGRAGEELSDCLAAVTDDFVARAAAAFADAAASWSSRLAEQAARHARAEAEQFRRYLLCEPRAEDLTVLADLASRLEGYPESQAFGRPSSSQGVQEQTAGLKAAGGHRRACDICNQTETALNDYLIARQLRLASREEDQIRYARTGGFCSLHTWQYARMASPVGISAGTARLAQAVADSLAEIGSGDAGTGQFADAAARLAARSACPVCEVLNDAERTAADKLARSTTPAEPPALCLRHLALVLQAGPSREAARAMMNELAQALQRLSADMRSYALKREALRRGLITDDEDAAYRDALALLAGRPALVQSWETK